MKLRPALLITLALLVGTSLSPAVPAAEPAPAPSGWSDVGGDPGGSRWSGLEQIDRKNVWRLEKAWTWRHGEFQKFPDRRPFAGFHATPILVPADAGGSLVVCTPSNRLVALDPATGTERWKIGRAHV